MSQKESECRNKIVIKINSKLMSTGVYVVSYHYGDKLAYLLRGWVDEKLTFTLEDHAHVTRRNLILSCSVAWFLLILQPNEKGVYDVNIGIIKGHINSIEFLYFAVIVSCIYQLLLFNSYFKVAITKDYEEVVNSAYRAVISMKFEKEIKKSLKNEIERNKRMLNVFDGLSVGRNYLTGVFEANLKTTREEIEFLHDYNSIVAILKENHFTVFDKSGSIEIIREFSLSEHDYNFINKCKDFKLRWSKHFFLLVQLPRIYAVISLLALIYLVLNGSWMESIIYNLDGKTVSTS